MSHVNPELSQSIQFLLIHEVNDILVKKHLHQILNSNSQIFHFREW
jgi:hypothetical protein